MSDRDQTPMAGDPVHLDAATASKMLESVFAECDVEPNSVPMEALASYSPVHKLRVDWRVLVAFACVACALLATFLLASPRLEVVSQGMGDQGLPTYAIRVRGLVPVRTVRAALDGEPVAVSELEPRLYEVEPAHNGELTVMVTLANNRTGEAVTTVTDVDVDAPELLGSEVGDTEVSLLLADDGCGIDFAGVYALTASREVVRPISVDEEAGRVTFAFPEESLDVFVPDNRGNTLHLAMSLES